MMGAIMSIGVSVANAVLLVTFAQGAMARRRRRSGDAMPSRRAAGSGRS